MSAAPTYLLFCDEPGCEETFLAAEALTLASTPRRLSLVRASAARQGWTSRTVEPGEGHKFARVLDTCVLCAKQKGVR